MSLAYALQIALNASVVSALYYGQASFYSGLIVGLKTLFVAVAGGLDTCVAL